MGLRIRIAEAPPWYHAGLNGWFRYGSWAAHLFVDGEQQCVTQHTYAEGGMARGLPPTRPKPAELTPHGQPYGRTCSRCLKVWKRTTHLQTPTGRGK